MIELDPSDDDHVGVINWPYVQMEFPERTERGVQFLAFDMNVPSDKWTVDGTRIYIEDIETAKKFAENFRRKYQLMMALTVHPALPKYDNSQSEANKIQIGGSHYKDKSIEPWDFYGINKLDPFVSSAIKYITRWRDKGGLDDLKKGLHHLMKRAELVDHNQLEPSVGAQIISTKQYIEANEIDHQEARILYLMIDGGDREIFSALAIAELQLYIDSLEGEH